MDENQSIDGRAVVEAVARQQGLSESETQKLMSALDDAVGRHLEQSARAAHQKLTAAFSRSLALYGRKAQAGRLFRILINGIRMPA
ncbi:MAG: hypothetical protein HPY45_01860 [Anaerolineae bacterium]|nr:hypothetical protein [Anaerolineae bacterium]